ncbi:MAG TPA: tetratricopeptide repeat protein [Pirellulaceae bacterium]
MLDQNAIAAEIDRIDRLIGARRVGEAEKVCNELLKQAPTSAIAWFRMGLLLLEQNRNAEAEKAFREALVHEPRAAAIWDQLALVLQRQGLAAEAEFMVRRATLLEPANSMHWNLLGKVLFDLQRLDESVQARRQSLAIQPRDAAAWNELGVAEQARKNFDEAEKAFQNSLAITPGHPIAVANYAYLMCSRGERDRACELLQPLVVRDPFAPEHWMALGGLFEAMLEWKLAASAYRRAWELAPNNEQTGFKLAGALHSNHQATEAEKVLRAHLALFPRQAESLALLGEVLLRQCRSAEGVPIVERAVEMTPDPQRHSKLLLEMQYEDNANAKQLLLAHRRWDTIYAKPLAPTATTANRHERGNPLRIGLVSRDFGHHPAAFLVLPGLEHLDRTACQLICYSDRTNGDEFTARFRAASSIWRTVFGLPDDDVAALIRRDNVDVLVDLMGHTGQRMLLFARKPAPFQVTWFGYVGTTGLATMNCLLADRFHVREGEDKWYRERILRMPNSYACYGPPQAAPEVGPLPALVSGHVTFGSFNNPPKYSATIREAWAEILNRVPRARLLLKFRGLDDLKLQSDLRGWFEERGVKQEQIELEGGGTHFEMLDAYNRVDIALDTQPYSGGVTTCEALWMGVPVITFPGDTFAGRHATSYLTTGGYPQFVATNTKAYVNLAVEWANRLDELAVIRSRMRSAVLNSALCRAADFAGNWLEILSKAIQTL